MQFQDYTVSKWDNLITFMKWDPTKTILKSDKDDVFSTETKPSVPVPLNTDAVRAVTQTSFKMLELLFGTYQRALRNLNNDEYDLPKSAETIQIFMAFWTKETQDKYKNVLAIAEAEANARNFKIFTNRDEIDRLKYLIKRMEESKDLLSTFSFKPHVGSNDQGLIISETVLKYQHSSHEERRIFRLKGSTKQKDVLESRCTSASISIETSSQPYTGTHQHVYRKGSNGQTVRFISMPKECNEKWNSHDCPVTKAHEIVAQFLAEQGNCTVVADDWHKEWLTKVLNNPYQPYRVVARPHPFFEAIKP